MIIFLTIAFLLFSCKKENQQTIPDVAVSFRIDPTSALYSDLNPIGGWVYVTGGYRGILLYHLSQDEFLAFDRACPYDYEKPAAQVEIESSGITLIDSCCLSRFIILDGSPFAGPARNSLKQYRTSYDGNYLYVFN